MVLGQGSFGKVILAELKFDKTLYAIKTLRKDNLIQTRQIQNLISEKNIMLEVDHPFLVSLDYVFSDAMRIHLVMPFINGGELYQIAKQKGRLEEHEVKFYTVQVILALGYLHSKGIVHRDLKLENVMIDKDGYIKLIDYGLAKVVT